MFPQAYIICSSLQLLKEELKHLEDVLIMKNNFKNKHTVQAHSKFESKDKSHLLLLPYQGEKGLPLTKSLKRNLKSLLPSTVKSTMGFTGKNLSTCFQIKNQSLNTNIYRLLTN